ncbi:hypothetical protein GCM10017667_04260 [Streptomyces filamentosus]|uniref:Uncharacterized protein n=1 Tax=Streptomyces filamentosus TaxID=67294 RepID=A0A919BCM3_STRFL|nr:hypothetical protein GCM10017667_04260 [Streptomyces filamentosus]
MHQRIALEPVGQQEALVYEFLELDGLLGQRFVEHLGGEHAQRDFFLGRKVEIQRPLRHPGTREDLADGRPLVATLREDPGGGLEDRLPGSDGTRLLRQRALPQSHCVLPPCDAER